MDFYFVVNDLSDPDSAPSSIQCMLHETFVKKGVSKPMRYDWVGPVSSIYGDPLGFPDQLWLICDAPNVSFDWMAKFDGYIVSDDFLKILDEDDLRNFKMAALNVVDQSGNSIADKTMHYMKFNKIVDGIDLEKSVWLQSRLDGQPLFSQSDGKPVVAMHKKIALDDTAKSYDIVELSDAIYANLLISDNIKQRLSQANLTGPYVFSVDDYYANAKSIMNFDKIELNLTQGKDTYAA